jgi:hypothetical protein
MKTHLLLASFALVAPLAVAACGSDDDLADGTLVVRVYGEDFIEEAIPAATFVDGWSVTFDAFLVSIGGIGAEAGHDGAEVQNTTYKVFDLAQPSGGTGFELARLPAPGGVYDHFGYVIRPSAEATAGNATAGDVDALKAAGYSVWVKGSARQGATTVRFDWGFALAIVHSHCEVEATIDGDEATVEATIHGDHLFYDDAVSTEPNVAFALIAAADGAGGGGADGAVSLDELAAVDITAEEHYGVGSLPIRDLRAFVTHQVGTVGHVDGEGHCDVGASAH